MKNVLREIHRRSLWQVLGIYLAASWLALQVVGTLADVVGIPDWFGPVAIGMLVIGLPIVLTTAFVQKGAPGMSRPLAKPFADPAPAVTASQAAAAATRPTGGAPAPQPAAAAADDLGAHHRLFTWRNAIAGGVLAFALLGVLTLGWFGLRAAGIGPAATLVAQGVLEDRDEVILADFANGTDDPTLGQVITEAVRVDLSQSDVVRFVDRGFVSDALERMQRPPDTELTEEIAREIGQREGIKAIVAGDVAAAGGGYVLTARLVSPAADEVLASVRETVRSTEDLLDGIDRLANGLRERIGDPLRSIAAAPPLVRAATGNLEALEKYTESVRLPAEALDRSLALLEEAVALDSGFAMAWRSIGISLNNYGIEPGRATAAHIRAYELRDRLPEMERLRVDAFYYTSVTRDNRQAIPVFQAMLDRNPDNLGAVNNMGEAYRNLGDLARAERAYVDVLARDSMEEIALLNLAQVQASQGRFGEALATSDLIEARVGGSMTPVHKIISESARTDYRAAEAYIETFRERAASSPSMSAFAEMFAGGIAGAQGRLAEAQDRYTDVAHQYERMGAASEAITWFGIASMLRPAVAGREPDLASFEANVAPHLEETTDPATLLNLTLTYAELGSLEKARAALERFETTTPPEVQQGMRFQHHQARGYVALADGRPQDAVAEFRLAVPDNLEDPTALAELAWAYDAAGATDSAAAYFKDFADRPAVFRLGSDSRYLGPSLEKLAMHYDEQGDLENAAIYYARFVELWAEADPELQPRVQAAQARLEEIVRERG